MYQYLSEAVQQYKLASCTQYRMKKDAKQLSMYMYIITEGKVCIYAKTHCKCPLGQYSCLLNNNIGRFYFQHMPIRVNITVCFWPISCMCSICVCQVAFELYHSSRSRQLCVSKNCPVFFSFSSSYLYTILYIILSQTICGPTFQFCTLIQHFVAFLC